MPATPSDYRLTFADRDFVWAGERRPGLPILRWADGTLCQPVITYFGYSAEVRRVQTSSMKPEAYAIREWLAFLANKGKRWDEASDLLLAQWRESHRDAVERGLVEARQVGRKLDTVFEFYRLLPEALPLDEAGEPRRPFVGKTGARDGVACPITSKTLIGPHDTVREVWSGAERFGKARSKRPTPGEADVGRILTWLRGKADRQDSRRPGHNAHEWAVLEGERNWLIGRCMVDGGLRAEEASNLSLGALLDAMRAVGIACPPGPWGVLDAVAADAGVKTGILAALDALEAGHHRCLHVGITGKGRKTRNAPFTLDLIRDLLEVGVWTVRRRQLDAWGAADRSYRPPPQVFLSFKTREPMLAGTVADLMKDAFKGVGVEGSGHRLRAHYATIMAARLWDECFAMNGYRFDQTVVNTALDRLAEALGHARVTTTVRHYLDMALLRHFGVANREKLDAVRLIWDAVVRRQGALTEGKMRLILKVVDGLAATPDGAELDQVISMAVEDESMNPAVAAPPRQEPDVRRGRGGHLRLVE